MSSKLKNDQTERVRNILTLDERVKAIEAYDVQPMYTKVAKLFNCGWEQIKNIILNRNAIMEFYEVTRNNKNRKDDVTRDDMRDRKISFLGECMYEYIQRAQFHSKVEITVELICLTAFEFRDLIQIKDFTPNKSWINRFKAKYNFSLSNRQIVLTRTPPASLDLKDIMTYCTKHNAKTKPATIHSTSLYRPTTKTALSNANDATLHELQERRHNKINLLEKVLVEYAIRLHQSNKTSLYNIAFRNVAIELIDMLKIENFTPHKIWLSMVRNRYESKINTKRYTMNHSPALSLDLKDIISYCNRMENMRKSLNSITITPKPVTMSSFKHANQKAVKRQVPLPIRIGPPPKIIKEETVTVEEDDFGLDIKPDISAMIYIPINEIENSDPLPPVMKVKNNLTIKTTPSRQSLQPSQPPQSAQIAFEPKTIGIMQQPKSISQNSIKISEIFKINKISDLPTKQQLNASSERSNSRSILLNKSDEHLPKIVRNHIDALKLLKPIEEFAMLQENFRVIGLISQLEDILKCTTKKKDNCEEEED